MSPSNAKTGSGGSAEKTTSADGDTAAWVASACNHEADGQRQLYRHFVALVHGVLLSRFRPAIAEELTQECFLLAFRKLGQLREPAKFGAWIVAIARRMRAADDTQPFDTDLDQVDAGQIMAPENLETDIDAEKALRIIRSLPEAYRETLVLRLVEGLSGAEIAAATGLSPDSVRVNLHRGMQKLREALAISVTPKVNDDE